jgi:predicted RNA methylase
MRARQLNALDSLRGLSVETTLAGVVMSEMRPRFHALRDREKPRAVSAFNLFQTPAALALRLAEVSDVNRSCRVLEPSAGLGRLLDAAQGFGAWDFVAVESSKECVSELRRQCRPETLIYEQDFLTCTTEELGQFDRILMNPPFHLRSDLRHIFHALKFLRKGGRLAGICMAGPARERELRPLCATWEPLPAGTFRAEGTNVETILFTIQN